MGELFSQLLSSTLSSATCLLDAFEERTQTLYVLVSMSVKGAVIMEMLGKRNERVSS